MAKCWIIYGKKDKNPNKICHYLTVLKECYKCFINDLDIKAIQQNWSGNEIQMSMHPLFETIKSEND